MFLYRLYYLYSSLDIQRNLKLCIFIYIQMSFLILFSQHTTFVVIVDRVTFQYMIDQWSSISRAYFVFCVFRNQVNGLFCFELFNISHCFSFIYLFIFLLLFHPLQRMDTILVMATGQDLEWGEDDRPRTTADWFNLQAQSGQFMASFPESATPRLINSPASLSFFSFSPAPAPGGRDEDDEDGRDQGGHYYIQLKTDEQGRSPASALYLNHTADGISFTTNQTTAWQIVHGAGCYHLRRSDQHNVFLGWDQQLISTSQENKPWNFVFDSPVCTNDEDYRVIPDLRHRHWFSLRTTGNIQFGSDGHVFCCSQGDVARFKFTPSNVSPGQFLIQVLVTNDGTRVQQPLFLRPNGPHNPVGTGFGIHLVFDTMTQETEHQFQWTIRHQEGQELDIQRGINIQHVETQSWLDGIGPNALPGWRAWVWNEYHGLNHQTWLLNVQNE